MDGATLLIVALAAGFVLWLCASCSKPASTLGNQMDSDSTNPSSLGLVGIEERVKALGGSLAVSSWPSRGTLLSVEIPLAPLAHTNG